MFRLIGRLLGRTGSPPPYHAFTKRWDWIAEASDVLAWNDPSRSRSMGRKLPPSYAPRLENPEPAIREGQDAVANLLERWASGHGLGNKPLVTVLVDHSGSMVDGPAQVAAISSQLIGDLCERLGLAFEILGFTTSTWKGGEAFVDWKRRWRPKHPGRLNDLLHIIYQDANVPRPSWRCDLKLMAERWVLKENIDGEALEWAWQRAQAFAPSTWLCVVISDGAPVDDATILANGDTSTNWYLQQHLESVIARMSGLTSVRLGGLGLLHKVPWYPRNVEAKDLEEVPAAAIHLLEQLIWQDEQAPS